MSSTWHPKSDAAEDAHFTAPSFIGWGRVLLRGMTLLTILGFGVLIFLSLRLVERPLFGAQRPWTPWITVRVCKLCLKVVGIHYELSGDIDPLAGALVSNHVSWLDIFVLNVAEPIYFVSKSEVAVWPLIGTLAKITGTLFIERKRREAAAHVTHMQERISIGHKLAFFPEGTSTDGLQVLPFKTTLFQSFFHPDFRKDLAIQPVTMRYIAPKGADSRFYGWWGDMSFGAHLLYILSHKQQGRVRVTYHSSVKVLQTSGRKELASRLENAVRSSAAV